MNRGTFVISLDFELFWGLAGWNESQLEGYRPRVEGAINALRRITETLKKYDMKCTIGFVGGINYKTLEDFLEASPFLRPTYSNQLFSSYGVLHKLVKNDTIDRKLLFRPDAITMLQENPLVELASHTFSHYYALEDGQTMEQFEADIRTAHSEACKSGIEQKSIIFPRNQIPKSYHEVCARCGFTHIRGNEESLLYRSESTPSKFDYKRVLRLLDCYINLTGHHSYKSPKKGLLIDVTASRFFRPYSHTLRMLEPLKVKRIKDDIKFAAKRGEIYHLWWHPHNFGINTDVSIRQLEEICKCFSEMRDKYGMKSAFMCEL